mmetsp:Transcript_2353/g.3456  ORF Transcript_2353/g.3456 Transcript_2353/m.3456 type:complete len:86 (-) Transcript_2353:77-334(-)
MSAGSDELLALSSSLVLFRFDALVVLATLTFSGSAVVDDDTTDVLLAIMADDEILPSFYVLSLRRLLLFITYLPLLLSLSNDIGE